ncbi:BTA121 domain-containing protein surface lipoprotein [Borrelia persica]|uniref:BTA121 domain-containing protein surface lipoprotein n=2 Tax=Borrelia persica TaxID=44448 RepID=UPI000464F56F|nr:CRASP family complement regulator-acquiring lipoprotein [Borrelia persica]
MKLIYYSLILLLIVLLSCKTQSSPPVGAHSGVFPEIGMGAEGKSIDKLLDTFNLSDEQKKAAEYLRKALVDDAKTYSNNTFHDFLSQLDTEQVKKIMDNIFEHICFMSESQVSINVIQDLNVKDNLQNRLLIATEEYLRLLKDYYSDISVSVQERYARLSDPSNGANLQSISNDAAEGFAKEKIVTLLGTFDLSDEQKQAAEYLKKALVDDAKTYSNDTFYDLLSQLGADQVKTIVNNMLDNHHLRLFYQASENINSIQDSNVKEDLDRRLKEEAEKYSVALKGYSDISLTIGQRYSNLSGNENVSFDFQGISDDSERERQREMQAKVAVMQELRDVANSDEISRVFTAHSASEPDDRYGMEKVFSILSYNSVNERDVERRSLIYLAFGYESKFLGIFGTIFYKYFVGDEIEGGQVGLIFNVHNRKEVERVFGILERFSQLYYLSSFKNLREKEANLDKLELEDLSTLKQQFKLLDDEKKKLVTIKDQTEADYDADVGRIKTVVVRKNVSIALLDDTIEVLTKYLKDKTHNYEATLNNVVEKVKKVNDVIIAILNKI